MAAIAAAFAAAMRGLATTTHVRRGCGCHGVRWGLRRQVFMDMMHACKKDNSSQAHLRCGRSSESTHNHARTVITAALAIQALSSISAATQGTCGHLENISSGTGAVTLPCLTACL